MTPDLLDLGRRAVACPRWRWLRGMSTLPGTLEEWACVTIGHPMEAEYTERGAIPDLSDPATLGCLLALVREAWGDPLLVVVYFRQEGRWCVASRDGRAMFAAGRYFWGDIEPAALIAALEAAP